jgi:hypothetical protein
MYGRVLNKYFWHLILWYSVPTVVLFCRNPTKVTSLTIPNIIVTQHNSSTLSQTFPLVIFTCVGGFAKSDYQFRHVCPSILPSIRPSVRPSVRLFPWNNSAFNGESFVKYDVRRLLENLSRQHNFE